VLKLTYSNEEIQKISGGGPPNSRIKGGDCLRQRREGREGQRREGRALTKNVSTAA